MANIIVSLKLELKHLFEDCDLYADDYELLKRVFETSIDAINSKEGVLKVKKLIYDYDLLYSDDDEIEQTGIPKVFDTMIAFYENC